MSCGAGSEIAGDIFTVVIIIAGERKCVWE
jgi:hypothetical protein